MRSVSLDEIDIDPMNMRFDCSLDEKNNSIKEMTDDIQKNGIINPLLIRDGNNGSKYWAFGGSRRILIAKQCGLLDVPCLYYGNISDGEALQLSWSENLNQQPTLYQKILHFKNMVSLSNFDFEDEKDLKNHVKNNGNNGSSPTIYKYLYLIKLPPDVLILSKTREELTDSDKNIMKFYTAKIPCPPSGYSYLSQRILYLLAKKLNFPDDMITQIAYSLLGKKRVEIERFIDFCNDNRFDILKNDVSIAKIWEKYVYEQSKSDDSFRSEVLIKCNLSNLTDKEYGRLSILAVRNHKKIDKFARDIAEQAVNEVFISEVRKIIRN